MMQSRLATTGIPIDLRCEIPSVRDVLAGCTIELAEPAAAPLSITIESERMPFDTDGWEPVTRSAFSREGSVVVRDAATSGFDLLLRADAAGGDLVFRRSASVRSRFLRVALPARGRLLLRSALLQYPAMWWAGTRDRAPLHAPVLTVGEETVLLVGASGVGKSTLVHREASEGARVVSDNLAVSDGYRVWGVAEPSRIEGGSGPRTTNGRRELELPGLVPDLVPDRVVILRRGGAERVSTRPSSPAAAARMLAASTYAAGELRRFWPFAATLAAATAIGPPHPPVQEVARTITERCECIELVVPEGSGLRLREMLQGVTTSCG